MNPYEPREKDEDTVDRIEKKIEAITGLAFLAGMFFAIAVILFCTLLERFGLSK